MIATRLKSLRKMHGITQEQLAAALAIERSSIAKYESPNKPVTPPPDVLLRISKYFGVSVDYLLGVSDSPEPIPHSAPEEQMKAAFWGGDKDLSQEDLDSMWADVKNFAAFVADQKKREKRQNG